MGIKVLKFFFFNQQSTFPLGQPSRPLNLVKINPGMLHVASLKYIFFSFWSQELALYQAFYLFFPLKLSDWNTSLTITKSYLIIQPQSN